MTETALQEQSKQKVQCLYMVFELSNKEWKLGFGIGGNPRIRTMAARDLPVLWKEIELAKEKLGLPPDAPVVSCYEAGRDGFWLHRHLIANGVQTCVST